MQNKETPLLCGEEKLFSADVYLLSICRFFSFLYELLQHFPNEFWPIFTLWDAPFKKSFMIKFWGNTAYYILLVDVCRRLFNQEKKKYKKYTYFCLY